jgi:sulfur transfer complex TusBCD TusB component (DsrH family)
VNYLNGIYQYVKQDHVLQFDGEKTIGVYALNDSLMQRNLVGRLPQQPFMEHELKAIIQQYMERMTQDRLQPSENMSE